MISRISVDSGRAKSGAANAIRVKQNGKLEYAEMVKVGGGMFVTSSIPRPYGAHVWFETDEPVVLCVASEEMDEGVMAA